MKSKLDLVSQDIHFPRFDPTIHSWFKNKWDEPESEDSKSLGIDIKNEFDKLYEHKHSVYNLLDTSPYTNLMPLLQRLYNQGVQLRSPKFQLQNFYFCNDLLTYQPK